MGHLVQAAPLLLLVILAWWRPLVGGLLLVAVGAVVFGFFLTWDSPWPLAVLPIVGGLLLVLAGWAGRARR